MPTTIDREQVQKLTAAGAQLASVSLNSIPSASATARPIAASASPASRAARTISAKLPFFSAATALPPDASAALRRA